MLAKVHWLFSDYEDKLKTHQSIEVDLAKNIVRVHGREQGEAIAKALALRVNLDEVLSSQPRSA